MIYDLLIIGAGPGGYVAALRAAQLGLTVAIFEKSAPGGVCLNLGCIPTKSLIKSAETAYSLATANEHGVEIQGITLNYAKAHGRSRKISDNLSKGVLDLFKRSNITLISEPALLLSGTRVKALTSGTEYEGSHIILATGSSPKRIPGFETDGERIIHSETLILRDHAPKSLLILGAGAIGVEFSFVFNAYQTEVTLIELMETILPLEDKEMGKALERELKKKKIKVRTATKALAVRKTESGVELEVERAGQTETLAADTLLIAVGRTPNTIGLGLDTCAIQTDSRGFIQVNEHGQTACPTVYAIGDIINTPLLAHVASHEGIHAVDHLAGKKPHPIDYSAVPSCTYTVPQVASFGLSEEKLKEKNIEYNKGTFSLKGNGKAMTLGENSGLVKLLTDKKEGRLLGAHLIAPDAAEMIHELLVAHAGKLPASILAATMHAHPTLSESIMEAALALTGEALHA